MKLIEVGDKVEVRYCDGRNMVDAYVRCVPSHPGGTWVFEWNKVLIEQNPLSSNLDAIIKKKDREEEGGR